MTLNPGLKKFIDIAGVAVALIADLTIIPICMFTIAPDALTKTAFIMIGVVIVLFVFRSWSTGWVVLWLVFASLVFFFDYSFALATMKNKDALVAAEKNIELLVKNDETIKSLNIDIASQKETVKSYVLDYQRPHVRATLDQIFFNQQAAQAKVDEYEKKRDARKSEISGTVASKVKMSSDDVFEAIPQAISDRRYMQLIVFFILFVGLQAITVTSIEPDEKKNKRKSVETQIKEVIKEVPVEVVKEVIKEIDRPIPEFIENKDDLVAVTNWKDLWRKNATSRKSQSALDMIDTIDRILDGRKKYITELNNKNNT